MPNSLLWTRRDQERLRFRLLVLGTPKCYISPFLVLIKHWWDHNGTEWTISRLKSLKVDLFRRKAGLQPLTWIRKNRANDLAGVFGGLFRWADMSEKNFRICIQILMVYTYWCSPSITEKQYSKFITAVTAQSPLINKTLLKRISKEANKFASKVSLPTPNPLLTYQGSPVKRSPRMFGRKSVPQEKKILDDIHIFNTEGGMYLYTRYRRLFEPILKGFKVRKDFLSNLKWFDKAPTLYGGNIAFIQEPGFKLRSVASPFRLFQEALKPFGEQLYRVARKMPWDCTHDQSAAFTPICDALDKGIKVYSIDLSSATDYFPLEIQVACVRSLVTNADQDYVNLWVELCRSQWKLPDGSYIRWSCGQPLGMFPSFAAFTISHGLLLKSLLKKRWNGEFYVVGDDVVILDETLATNYMRTLDEIGCPYSVDKTLQSEMIAEFAGKIVTSKGIYPQMKWREMSDDNFLDLCRTLGPRSYLLLRKRQKKIFDLVKNLREPVGLNMSIPGDNLALMIERTESSPFFNLEKVILNSLMGLRRLIHHHIYDDEMTETTCEKEISEIVSTFDEKVKSVMDQTFVSQWETMSALADGLSSLPEALDLKPRLPLEQFSPKRRTLLERYETILKFVS